MLVPCIVTDIILIFGLKVFEYFSKKSFLHVLCLVAEKIQKRNEK